MLILPAILIFSVMLAINLPALYAGARLAADASTADMQAYPQVAPIRPLLATVMLCGGVLPAWLMKHNPPFILFVLLLGSAAYIDCVTQWVTLLISVIALWPLPAAFRG